MPKSDRLLVPDVVTAVFPIAFDIAVAAVYKALLQLNQGIPVPKVEAPGLMETQWYVEPNMGISITVQKRADLLTSLDMAIIRPTDPILAILANQRLESIFEPLNAIYLLCGRAIIDSIRYTHPQYGMTFMEALAPPPPAIATKGDWIRFFVWREMHASALSWADLAARIGTPESTLKNHYSEYQRLLKRKRIPADLRAPHRKRGKKGKSVR